MSDDRITKAARWSDRLYGDGVDQWNDWLYKLSPLGKPGRALALSLFSILLWPIMLAGALRRLRFRNRHNPDTLAVGRKMGLTPAPGEKPKDFRARVQWKFGAFS